VDNGWGNNDMDDLLDDFAGTKKSNINEFNEPSRNSGGAYSGFGILGKNSAMNKSGSNQNNQNNYPTFGVKRNSGGSSRGAGP
jgi:hypothetical protein